jgi:tetratricopeptide (TPR) repeat protein
MKESPAVIADLRAVKELVAHNQLGRALDQLMDLLEEQREEEAYDQCVALYRRLHAREEKKHLGLVTTENFEVEINNVGYAMLRLCTQQIRRLETAPVNKAAGIAVGDLTAAPAAGSGSAAATPDMQDLLRRGIERYAADDYAGAVGAFEEVLEKDARSAVAAFYLGVIREEIGDYEGAVAFYNRAVEADPNYAEAYNNRGVIALLADDYDAALRDLNRALELNPKLHIAYLNRASVFVNLEAYAPALEDLDRCARSGTSLAGVFRLRSLTRLNLGDYAGAIDDADRGIRLNPGDFYYYFSKGTALINLGRYLEAAPQFEQALAHNPGHVDSLRLRAMSNCMIEDWSAARRDLDALLATHPDDDQGRYWLGFLFQQTGDPAAAVREYSRAIEINPYNKTAYFNRGLVAFQHGRYEEALRDFRTAQELDPQWELVPPYIRQAEEKLQGGFWKKWFG